MCPDGADMIAIWYNTHMASAYNLTVGISLAILLAILLGLLGVGIWRQLTRQMTRVGLVVFLIGAGIATVDAQKRLAPRQAADGGDEPVVRESPDEDCDTENSHSNLGVSAIAVTTTNVEVVASWSEGFFSGDVTLDILAAWPTLTNDWRWIKSVIVPDGHTNELVNLAPSDLMMTNLPSALFVRVLERNSAASTMDDFDNDGLPGFYELHYGTNPYVADSGSIRKLTVGADGDYPSIETALAASTNYSVISLGAGIHGLTKILDMPDHPVLIEGPSDGYAILQSDQRIAAIVMKSGEGRQTVFRNLIVDMRCRKGFQAAFWIGGNAPLTGRGASATFENVRIRANYPGTEYFGWQFYRDDGGPSLLKDCVMNAAGSTWAYGVSMYNAASNVIENCAFVNMPTNAGESTALAVFRRSDDDLDGVRAAPQLREDLSWAGCSLNGSYRMDVDSDGDGRSDYDEVFVDDTDPWLDDSDGDGMTDGEEFVAGTAPKDVTSHQYKINLTVANTVQYADTTNYVFFGDVAGWRSNVICSCTGAGIVTSVVVRATAEGGLAGAFVDLDRDGEFDAAKDVLQMQTIAVNLANVMLCFRFGDVDGDGSSDLQERLDGTDPYDDHSSIVRRPVKITDEDAVSNVADYYAVANGTRADGVTWSRMTGRSAVIQAEAPSTNRMVYVLILRDRNGNGIYDEGVDTLCSRGFSSGTATVEWGFGDADGDGLKDSEEWDEGTDPMDESAYCYSPHVRVKEIYGTPLPLTFDARFGTNEVVSATLVTNREWEADMGHLITTNREYVTVRFWEDSNSNRVWEAGERSVSFVVKPNGRGHRVYCETDLSKGGFDADGNGLLDWWEDETGLSSLDERHLDYDDNDHDGLVNLHEYWAGTNPLVPDGSNTLLSVCARSVDERIKDITSVDQLRRFVDIFSPDPTTRYALNTNFWAKDIDFSCVSAWHPNGDPGSKAATAITRRHVIMAEHWHERVYVFCDRNGAVESRSIIDTYRIDGTDILVGRLDQPLPPSFKPPKVLPFDYASHLFSGSYIPTVNINSDKAATVLEISKLDCCALNGRDKKTYYHLGMLSNLNRCSIDRRRIRGLTGMGNSGTPTFLIVGSESVFLFERYLGIEGSYNEAQGWGPMVTHWLQAIQDQIDNWEGANLYQIQILGLTDYCIPLRGSN